MLKSKTSTTCANIPSTTPVITMRFGPHPADVITCEGLNPKILCLNKTEVSKNGSLVTLLDSLLQSDLTASDLNAAKKRVSNILSYSNLVEPSDQMVQLLYEAHLVLSCILFLERRVDEAMNCLENTSYLWLSNATLAVSPMVKSMIEELTDREII